MKAHARVLYIDIDIHHGDGVEEAFYCTDRWDVMGCLCVWGEGGGSGRTAHRLGTEGEEGWGVRDK